jgi:chaperonin GroEL
VEDALFATKAALTEGVVPGGGIALINAFNTIGLPTTSVNDDQKGWDIVRHACGSPFKTILSNCGIEDYYSILRDVMDTRAQHLASSGDDDLFTYDAKAQKVVHAVEAGLLDPTKVTRTALENAASVAGTILTTESVIFEKKEEKSKEEDMMPQY